MSSSNNRTINGYETIDEYNPDDNDDDNFEDNKNLPSER